MQSVKMATAHSSVFVNGLMNTLLSDGLQKLQMQYDVLSDNRFTAVVTALINGLD